MLIILCGYSKSGMDTIAAHLPGTRLALADGMKELFCVAAGITVAELEANKERYRPALVEFGRKGRELTPTMWIEPVVERMSRSWPAVQDWHITDCRYRNEADWFDVVPGRGVHLFYIHRENIGPANDEERDSIAELRRVLNPVVITNTEGSPEIAAATILEHITKAKVNV